MDDIPTVVLDGVLELGDELGSGGMGTVFRALHTRLGRPVAVKLLAPELTGRPFFRRRFAREAQALAMLNHPNIVTVHDFSEADGEAYIVMELVDGQPLSDILPVGMEALTHIAMQICDALDAAHEQGIVHRDIKPANVLVDRSGHVKITDFGIARIARASELAASITNPGRPMGTPQYMSPEALAGAEPDPRMDIYSLGVLLYEMAMGTLRLSDLSGLPDGLDGIVRRCLARNPLHRYQSALALRDDLEHASEPTHLTAGVVVRPPERRTNLPPRSDTLVGRDGALPGLTEDIVENRRRLLSLVGPPGVGKTRLAVEVAARSQVAFDGGVWFCDLTEATSIEDVCSAVAGTLEAALPATTSEEAVSLVANVLRARGRTLFILDNLEQIVELSPKIVEPWLQAAPDTQFIVTSREALNIGSESVYDVAPLKSADGIQLFLERVRVHRSLEITDSNVHLLDEIVSRLDGLPLAIELAAARASILSLTQLNERLARHLDLLRETRRDSGRRHATLRGAIEWSWSLLDEIEQQCLAQASVFRGGFSLEAAEAVIRLPDDIPDLLSVLESLRAKSLLHTFEPEALPGTMRLRMYESIRELAAERMWESPYASAAASRHTQYYLHLAEACAAGVDSFGGTMCLNQLTVERENIGALYERAEARMSGSEYHQTIALRALLALDTVVWVRGPYGPMRARLADAIDNASPEIDRGLRARALKASARLRRTTGDLTGIPGVLEQAMFAAQAVGDVALQAAILSDLGLCAFDDQGHLRLAERTLMRSIQLARESHDRYVEGLSTTRLAALIRLSGSVDEARALNERAVSIFRSIGNERLEAIVLSNIATIHQEGGYVVEALSAYEQCLPIQRRLGNWRSLGICMSNMGFLYREQEDFDAADRVMKEALAQMRKAGDRRWEAIVTGHYGSLLHEVGELQSARKTFELALEQLGEAPAFSGLFRAHLASVLAELGRTADAARAMDRAEEEFKEVDNVPRRETLKLARAHVELAQGRRAAAEEAIANAEAGVAPQSEEVRLAVRLLRRRLLEDPVEVPERGRQHERARPKNPKHNRR